MDTKNLFSALERESAREFYFLAIALILAFGLLQTTGSVLGTDKPVVSVVSCSMYPQLHVGDILLVKGTGFDEIDEGEVVVYSVAKLNFTIDAERYSVGRYAGPEKVDTPAGEFRIEGVRVNQGGDAVEALVSINGEKTVLREGEVYQVNGETVRIGEVMGMNIPIVHRVKGKYPNRLETQGDNNNAQLEFEKNVKPGQVHGKVLFNIPRIGGLKILAMDLVGFRGDQPLVIDSFPRCTRKSGASGV